MKLETLLTRYKSRGYQPLYVDMHLELANLNKWLFDNYQILVYVSYNDIVDNNSYLKFTGCYKKNIGNEQGYNQSYCAEKSFDNPIDANFDVLRFMYRGFKFNNKKIKNG